MRRRTNRRNLKEFRRQAAAFEKKGDEAELSAIEKIYRQRDLLLEQAARVKATEARDRGHSEIGG